VTILKRKLIETGWVQFHKQKKTSKYQFYYGGRRRMLEDVREASKKNVRIWKICG